MNRARGALLPIELAIIDALRDGTQYGYDLRSVGGGDNSRGYRALRRLEQMELIESREEQSETSGKPPRRYYKFRCKCRHPIKQHEHVGKYLHCLECLHTCPDVDEQR